jgi:hypothetical protein
MDRARLTATQAEAFRNKIRPMLFFLYRCRGRLDSRGFDQRSTTYQAVAKAYDTMHELHMKLHCAACGRGVWRREEK